MAEDKGEVKNESAAVKGQAADREPGILKRFLFLLIKTAGIVGALWILLTYVFGIYHFRGNYMFPAIRDGDLVITYRLDKYHLNEVAAYKTPDGTRFGRIVGMPGSEADITEEGLLIDGMRPAEEIFYATEAAEGGIALPLSIPDGAYFLLNDYRLDAQDGRTYGAVGEDGLEGKVICIFRRRGI